MMQRISILVGSKSYTYSVEVSSSLTIVSKMVARALVTFFARRGQEKLIVSGL